MPLQAYTHAAERYYALRHGAPRCYTFAALRAHAHSRRRRHSAIFDAVARRAGRMMARYATRDEMLQQARRATR